MTPLIETSFDATEAEAEALLDIIVEANRRNGVPSDDSDEMIIRLQHPDSGALIGGLYAERYYGWLYVRLLAVPEVLRGQGWGTRLLEMAEARARVCGCVGVWLDSFSFQAAPFYRQRGYIEFGAIDSYPPGHQRVFFHKRLAGAAPLPL